MNNTNLLISADNKGVAQLLFEKDMNPGAFTGQVSNSVYQCALSIIVYATQQSMGPM